MNSKFKITNAKNLINRYIRYFIKLRKLFLPFSTRFLACFLDFFLPIRDIWGGSGGNTFENLAKMEKC